MLVSHIERKSNRAETLVCNIFRQGGKVDKRNDLLLYAIPVTGFGGR
jgi:hypothetical protein